MSDDLRTRLLVTVFRHVINEPNLEAGLERFAELACLTPSAEAFAGAIAACLADGLIREPIRLPEGALQCYWRLELTPKGVTEARRLVANCEF